MGDEALINQGFLDANSMKYTGVFHDGILILEILPRDPGMVPETPLSWRINPHLSSF